MKAIRRVSAPAVEDFVLKQIQRVTDLYSLDWSALRAMRLHRLLEQLNASPLGDLTALAEAGAPSDFRTRQVATIGFLAPDIQRAILEGRRQPALLTMGELFEVGAPLSWAEPRSVWVRALAAAKWHIRA